MTCPAKFFGKNFDLSATFTNASFFQENTIDHWRLEDFLQWNQHNYDNFNEAYLLLQKYHDALDCLKQAFKQMDCGLKSYITVLAKDNKYTKKAFKAWWEKQRHATSSSSSTTIINNRNVNISTSSDFTVTSAKTITTVPSPQQQQAQPQDIEALPQCQRQKRANDQEMESGQNKKPNTTDEYASTDSDDDQTDAISDASIVETMTDFLDANSFTRFHRYRLESHGIIQMGKNIQRQPDVPSSFYDQFALEAKPPGFPLHAVTNYFKSTVLNNLYGTRALAGTIFSLEHIDQDAVNEAETDYIMRAVYILSENIHCRRPLSRLIESEVSYCHHALWPLIDLACSTVNGMDCNFLVGETPLTAMKSLPAALPGYSADGTVFLNESGLEILLFEASGPFGTRDRARHSFDHVKGAYGCYSMLHAILTKYPYADKNIMEDLAVLFLHSSGKDNHIRLWVMKICCSGTVITFERMEKATITTNFNDKREAIELTKFFWVVKGMLERSRDAINKLRNSNDMNYLLLEDEAELNQPLLPSLLTPRPIKPTKGRNDCKGMADLDPVSSLF